MKGPPGKEAGDRGCRSEAEATPREATDRTAKREAFEREALPHLDVLYRYALRLANGDEHCAQDFVQDAMLQAWRSWHTYRAGTNCRAWLMSILRHAMINHHRSERKRASNVEFDEISERAALDEGHETDPEGRFFHRRVDGEIVDAIQALPIKYREAVILSDLEGLGYAEMSEILEVPVGTVKSRLFRARKLLQEALYDYAIEMGFARGSEPGPGVARSSCASRGR